jgi:hypothetical protein
VACFEVQQLLQVSMAGSRSSARGNNKKELLGQNMTSGKTQQLL